MVEPSPPLLVAITGASGVIYGIRILEELKKADVPSHLIMSTWAARTITAETDRTPGEVRDLAERVYEEKDLDAAPASGGYASRGMVVAPCSMKSLAIIANGLQAGLIQRAAETTLHEDRRLVLLTRETPLSAIHLENMLVVARAGAMVVPPVPAFYAKPATIDDIVNHTVGRVLDAFGIEHQLVHRWGERRSTRLAEP